MQPETSRRHRHHMIILLCLALLAVVFVQGSDATNAKVALARMQMQSSFSSASSVSSTVSMPSESPALTTLIEKGGNVGSAVRAITSQVERIVASSASAAKPVRDRLQVRLLRQVQKISTLLEGASKASEGQVLMIVRGLPTWVSPFDAVFHGAASDEIAPGYGRRAESFYPGTNERHYAGGGATDGTASMAVAQSVINQTIVNQSGSGANGSFTGLTSVTSYNGSLGYSGKVGYEAGNAICAAEYAGSHFCRTDEILHTIAIKDISTLFSGINAGWIAEGPPGYTAHANDCRGWTSADPTELGPWWEFNVTGGGMGFLTTCASTKPLSCCK